MGLFSRHSSGPVDLRDRDYVLSGSPLVAQDDHVVLVDATVRLAVRQPADDEDPVLGYDPAEEIGVHAVCVEVRPHDPDRVSLRHEFRVVGS